MLGFTFRASQVGVETSLWCLDLAAVEPKLGLPTFGAPFCGSPQ